MAYDDGSLKPEDYVEPRCVLCGDPYGKVPEVRPVPQQRIIAKMDEYMSRRDYDGAERHLLYWLEEARQGNDQRGQLLIENELVGHYRKVGDRDNALAHGEAALHLLDDLDFTGTISSGTTYTNVATACNAFKENERAMELFEKARAVYEEAPHTDPSLLGGLYNNMGLTCVALKRWKQANALYDKALEIMKTVPGGELEQAITYLNKADALGAEKGMEEAESQIFSWLDTAYDLLTGDVVDSGVVDEGYYAFVCEKCAPTFSYYGYFLAADELNRRAEEIYHRE